MKSLLLVLVLFLAANAFANPSLELKDLQGNPRRFTDYQGKIVVLNFWATWCIPCRKEMPMFVELQNEYSARGVQFIAVSVDAPESQPEIPKFIKEFRLNFPVWIGTSEDQLSLGLGTGVPATLIFDRNLNPLYRIIGESTREMMVARFEAMLSDDSSKVLSELVLPPGISSEHWKEHELGLEDEHHEEEQMAEGGSEVPS